MRPETAQGMFMLYPALYRHFRNRLPFGAIQTGKGYRNEISPRQGMIRLREFNMAELEYFIDPEVEPEHDFSKWADVKFNLVPDPEFGSPVEMSPGDAAAENVIRHPTVAWFMARTWDFLFGVGSDPNRIRFRQHEGTEMAHYAKVEEGIVTKVIVAEADFFNTFVDDSPGELGLTSYNTRGNVLYAPNSNTPDFGTPLRKNYAGIGYGYDGIGFFAPKPLSLIHI